jgi:chitinase
MNSEINEHIEKNSVTLVLYEKEAVKVASWGNQWVAYDNEETLKMKSKYAQFLCLGGLMVRAITYDTKDAKYHTALGKAANRKILAISATNGSVFSSEDVAQGQCMRTNCGERKDSSEAFYRREADKKIACYDKHIPVQRTDKASRNNGLMIDEKNCGKGGLRIFCCPATATLPSCSWYTHSNGNCNSKCPDGKIEIGSNNM